MRAIGSDCNCCDSLQITIRRSLSPQDLQPVSAPPPFLPPPAIPIAAIRDSVMYGSAASNGNTTLRVGAVCKRSIGGVTCHPVDPVRATAADNDIALSASECTSPRADTLYTAFAL